MLENSTKSGFCEIILGSEENFWIRYHTFHTILVVQMQIVCFSNIQWTFNFKDGKIKSTVFTRPHVMKHQKIILPMLRNGKLKFKTPVNFEVKYFLNKETVDVLTDHQQYYPFYTSHQAWMTYYWIGHSNDFRTTQSNNCEGATIAIALHSIVGSMFW